MRYRERDILNINDFKKMAACLAKGLETRSAADISPRMPPRSAQQLYFLPPGMALNFSADICHQNLVES